MDDLKNQSGAVSDNTSDMDSFAELCERRLKEEHARIAAEKEDAPAPMIFPDKEQSDDDASVQESPTETEEAAKDTEPIAEQIEQIGSEKTSPEPACEEQNADENNSDISKNDNSDSSGGEISDKAPAVKAAPTVSAVVPAASVKNTESLAQFEDDSMPLWLRVLFSAVLGVLGAVGVWMLISNTSASYFLDALCFIEVAMCLITAVGINASGIAERGRKMRIMRTALWFVFAFYCLYTADTLFLHRAIESKFVIADFAEYARTHISFDLIGDLGKMSGWGIFECAFYVLPYTFCVPVLMKSYRNIILYFLYMTFSFLAVSTLRIVTMTGGASLAQCLVCLAGAAVTYIVVMLPPVQDILRKVGLLEWVELEEDED